MAAGSRHQDFLQAGVDLLDHVVSAVIGPIAASLGHGGRDVVVLDRRRLLHGVDVEASTDVPSDVAVERPDTWVVSVVLDDDVAVWLQKLDIAALGIFDVHNLPIPSSHTFRQHVEIVSMKMHGMCSAGLVVQDDTDAVVGAEVVYVPLGVVRIRRVSKIGKQEDWMVVIAPERLSVHGPDDITGLVRPNCDIDGLRGRWICCSWEWEKRRCLVERIIATYGITVCLSCRLRRLGGIGLVVVDGCNCMRLVGGGAFSAQVRSHEYC